MAPNVNSIDVDTHLKTEREIRLEAENERLQREVEELRAERRDRRVTGGSSLSAVSLADDAEDVRQVMAEASESELSDATVRNVEHDHKHHEHGYTLQIGTNVTTVLGSALGQSRFVQAVIYILAFGGVVFVLAAKATKLGNDSDHRRLGGGASMLLVQIAFCVASAGLLAFIVNMLRLPLILGYILGGILVGPIGLDIVHSQADIQDMSSLGLVFLLFMIGLELDVSEIMKMGRVVIGTGLLQFPLCAGVMTAIFSGFEAAGLSWGSGQYAALYVGTPCAISSTMIVVKLLSEHAQMDTSPGRLTIGILIFQDIWAIIVLAIQPDMANPKILGLLKTFATIFGLIIVALLYAKFVMPAIFVFTSRSIELMLIISLAWCFFMCCLATLPFIGLSMELAALISGVALATFPYSAEFIGKIKYIRDFFIILFFVGLGMQIPVPTVEAVGKAVLVALVVVLFRWLGIFGVAMILRSGHRLAALATINLSQVSEFALVICSLGMSFGHINEETLTIVIWSFAILAITSSYMIEYNYAVYGALCRCCRRLLGGKRKGRGDNVDTHEEGGDHVDRNIVLLGFHKVAAMLIAHFEHHSPHLLAKVHVIDFHENIMPELRKRGVTCAYGDISSPDVLEHAHHGDVKLVISSIPDSLLCGVDNLRLLAVSKQVWPNADVIVTADNPKDASRLYHAGAEYVLRMAKLCAERLEALIIDHSVHITSAHHALGQEVKLNHVFAVHREREKDDHLNHNFAL